MPSASLPEDPQDRWDRARGGGQGGVRTRGARRDRADTCQARHARVRTRRARRDKADTCQAHHAGARTRRTRCAKVRMRRTSRAKAGTWKSHHAGTRTRRARRALPPGRAVVVGLDDDHLNGHGCPKQVNHLLVGQRGHGHFADLHEAAALAEAGLPSKAERLHVGHDPLEVHVEAQLAQPVPPQSDFHRLAAPRHYLGGQEVVSGAHSGLHDPPPPSTAPVTRSRFNPVCRSGPQRQTQRKQKE